ncbi:MAG: hypothetical protein AB8G05_03405 [Oligoflexales bacterium]
MLLSVSCADDPLGSSTNKKESTEQQETQGVNRPISENATPVDAVKPLESGETWSLLTEEDIFTSKQDITIYRTTDTDDELCVLSPGLQFIILSKANTYLKIRLDRIAQDENCPLEEQSVGFIKTEDSETNSETEFESSELEPHRLTYDLKIYRSNDKTDQALCTVAKGNAVLINPSNTSIQVPYSKQCDPDFNLGYYRYVPGIWWEDQPR